MSIVFVDGKILSVTPRRRHLGPPSIFVESKSNFKACVRYQASDEHGRRERKKLSQI